MKALVAVLSSTLLVLGALAAGLFLTGSKVIRAAFPDRPWKIARNLSWRRRLALLLLASAWTAVCIGLFDAHWVHHVDGLGRSPCSTARWEVWATLAVAAAGAGGGYLAYRVSADGIWALWTGVGGALMCFLAFEVITQHTWTSQFLCYD
jgi:hypothetical protein